MNYLYFNYGKIPNYLNYSIKSIKKFEKDSNIFLASDQKIDNRNVTNINLEQLKSKRVEYIKNLRYFNNWNSNSLWESSLLRIFYLYELANFLQLNQFVHFDNDVVIFKPFNQIEKIVVKNKLNITPLSKDFLVFGYSYIHNLEIYNEICECLINVYENSIEYENNYYGGKKLIEMKALFIIYDKFPHLFNFLPTHPKQSESIIFDPASYGQYVSGVHKKRFSKKFTDSRHLLGNDLRNKIIKPKFKDKKPFVEYEGKKFDLVNLHIHSKKLRKFT